jgi:hypothetical protein
MHDVVELALDFLGRDPNGTEQYAWCENGKEALSVIVDAIFAASDDPSLLVDDLLRFAAALELELGSPTAASVLLSVLRSDARVLALVDRRPPPVIAAVRRAPMRRDEVRTQTVLPDDPKKRRQFGVSRSIA